MPVEKLLTIIAEVIDEKKGQNMTVIDVINKTSIMDYMVIVTAISSRHANALAHYVSEKAKQNNFTPLGIEGQQGSDWVLLDLGDVVLHIFTAQARDFYQLEKLWSIGSTQAQTQVR